MSIDIPKAWDAVKAWWNGEWVTFEPPVIGGMTHYSRSARWARKAWHFITTDWKWLFYALATVAGLWIAASKISGPEKAAPTSSVETPNAPPAPATHPDQK